MLLVFDRLTLTLGGTEAVVPVYFTFVNTFENKCTANLVKSGKLTDCNPCTGSYACSETISVKVCFVYLLLLSKNLHCG